MTRESLFPVAHPCYDRCFRIYRNALIDWHHSRAIQSAARTLGMGCRAYCDARLQANRFQWYSTTTDEPFTREHADAAYQAAVDALCRVGGGRMSTALAEDFVIVDVTGRPPVGDASRLILHTLAAAFPAEPGVPLSALSVCGVDGYVYIRGEFLADAQPCAECVAWAGLARAA